MNKGNGGNSTADLLSRIDREVLLQGADITMLIVGTNDMVNSRKLFLTVVLLPITSQLLTK